MQPKRTRPAFPASCGGAGLVVAGPSAGHSSWQPKMLVGKCLLLVLAACTLVFGCATPRPVPLPAAAPLDDDRAVLRRVATQLGQPLPKAHTRDPLGIAETGFEQTEVEVMNPPPLQRRETLVRAVAFRGRTARISLTFIGGCGADCSQPLISQLQEWLGPAVVVEEGHAQFRSHSFDTTTVRMEIFERRPDLFRLVLECTPLLEARGGRGSGLPPVGERPVLDRTPPCRGLPPVPKPVPVAAASAK